MAALQRFARVPAEVRPASWHKNAGQLAEAGQLTGRGTSQAAALADLGSQLAAMAGRVREAPAFWWDADNRVLWVTVPDAVQGGCTAYPVHMAGAVPTTSGGVTTYEAPAAAAMAQSAGIVPVGPPARRQPVDPELYARTAPRWTCISAPGEGPHYLSPGPVPPRGSCQWCGAPADAIRQQGQLARWLDWSQATGVACL